MRVLVSGTSGMVGSAVASHLRTGGHDVVPLVRRQAGPGEVSWDPDAGVIDAEACEGFDAVVHVASMRWPTRWTPKAKAAIRENRLRCNTLLAETIAMRQAKPRVFAFASGMGIYPSSGDTVITEDSPLGTDFLATLQRDGEAAASPSAEAGVRVVPLRIPAVLGGEAVRMNVGRIGDGRQWSSWVSRDELARIVEHVLVTDGLSGPVNACSPYPERNADYVAALSRVLGRRPGMPVPAGLLRLLAGEVAEAIVLASRRMEPRKLLESGYEFRWSRIEGALRHELEAL